MTDGSLLSKLTSLSIGLLLLLPYALLANIMHSGAFNALCLFGAVLGGYLLWSYYVNDYRPTYGRVFSISGLGAALVVTLATSVVLGWISIRPIALIHFLAVALIFAYLLVVTVAVYHELVGHDRFDPTPPFDPVTVIVPAYNEEGYVGRTIESILNAEYPAEKTHVVVVDDGSTDGTYEEATRYESEMVQVLTKSNGGKYSALNYALLFVDDEFVVTVDADSMIAPDALKRIVAPLQADRSIGAVASNVKILNRDSLVTKCQSLEYIFGINVYRRIFDHAGIVPIVPGCLGAFRRDVLEQVNAYDPQTLTEDFDTTLKVLLTGASVRVSDATVYTEAPDTWADLYNQRLRWYRGNYMTLFKHWRQLLRPESGYLHRLFLPIRIAEMFFLPLAAWVVLGVIAFLVATGSGPEILFLFLFFSSIVVLVNTLAVQIEREDLRHVLYAPLFVIGYKHFHDLIMLKSLVDVLREKNLSWTSASRVKQRQTDSTPTTETLAER